MDKLKEMFKGKKKTENLLVLLVLLIIVVIAINYIWNSGEKSENDNKKIENQNNEIKQVSMQSDKDKTEEKLENILSKISGVGKVRVMITYRVSSSITPVYDETSKISNTTENDDSGGTRTITQTENDRQIVYKENSDGSKEPITKNTESPKMEGAIIVAEGAENAEIKTNIIEAVEAATGLATHKIQVFKMEVWNENNVH